MVDIRDSTQDELFCERRCAILGCNKDKYRGIVWLSKILKEGGKLGEVVSYIRERLRD